MNFFFYVKACGKNYLCSTHQNFRKEVLVTSIAIAPNNLCGMTFDPDDDSGSLGDDFDAVSDSDSLKEATFGITDDNNDVMGFISTQIVEKKSTTAKILFLSKVQLQENR